MLSIEPISKLLDDLTLYFQNSSWLNQEYPCDIKDNPELLKDLIKYETFKGYTQQWKQDQTKQELTLSRDTNEIMDDEMKDMIMGMMTMNDDMKNDVMEDIMSPSRDMIVNKGCSDVVQMKRNSTFSENMLIKSTNNISEFGEKRKSLTTTTTTRPMSSLLLPPTSSTIGLPTTTFSFKSMNSSHKNALLLKKRQSILANTKHFGSIGGGNGSDMKPVYFEESKSNNNEFKKRNSEILAQINPILPYTSQANTRKSMIEIVKRGSLLGNFNMSPIKKVKLLSDFDLSSNNVKEEEDLISDSTPSESSNSSDEIDIEESFNIHSSPLSSIIKQVLLRLSFIKYTGLYFTMKGQVSEDEIEEVEEETNDDITDANLLDVKWSGLLTKGHEEEEIIEHEQHNQKRYKKIKMRYNKGKRSQSDQIPPFYLIGRDGMMVEGKIRKNEREWKVYKAKGKQKEIGVKNCLGNGENEGNSAFDLKSQAEGGISAQMAQPITLSIGKFTPKQAHPQQQQHQEFHKNDTSKIYIQTTTHASGRHYDTYILGLEGDYLSSGAFRSTSSSKFLQNTTLTPHFQAKFTPSLTTTELSSQMRLIQDLATSQDMILDETIEQRLTQYYSHDRLYARDAGSIRGTFVLVPLNRVVILKEKSLIMLNSRVGIAVKAIRRRSGSGDNGSSGNGVSLGGSSGGGGDASECDNNTEIICLNHITDDELSSMNKKMMSNDGVSKSSKMRYAKEYKELIEKHGCPYIKIAIVVCNSVLSYYEEKLEFYVVYNHKHSECLSKAELSSNLGHLDSLDHLSILDPLNSLRPLNSLDPLSSLNPLSNLDPLSGLSPLGSLDPLNSLDPSRMGMSGYSRKNWVNLLEENSHLQHISKALGIEYGLLLVYDEKSDTWGIEAVDHYSKHEEIRLISPSYYLKEEEEEVDSDHARLLKRMANENPLQEGMLMISQEKLMSQSRLQGQLKGLWLSLSEFNVLQEKFESKWVEIPMNSVIKFDEHVVGLGQQLCEVWEN